MTLSIMTLSIMILGIITHSIMTLSLMILGIITHSTTTLSVMTLSQLQCIEFYRFVYTVAKIELSQWVLKGGKSILHL
jgi:hypothetical protein